MGAADLFHDCDRGLVEAHYSQLLFLITFGTSIKSRGELSMQSKNMFKTLGPHSFPQIHSSSQRMQSLYLQKSSIYLLCFINFLNL